MRSHVNLSACVTMYDIFGLHWKLRDICNCSRSILVFFLSFSFCIPCNLFSLLSFCQFDKSAMSMSQTTREKKEAPDALKSIFQYKKHTSLEIVLYRWSHSIDVYYCHLQQFQDNIFTLRDRMCLNVGIFIQLSLLMKFAILCHRIWNMCMSWDRHYMERFPQAQKVSLFVSVHS